MTTTATPLPYAEAREDEIIKRERTLSAARTLANAIHALRQYNPSVTLPDYVTYAADYYEAALAEWLTASDEATEAFNRAYPRAVAA